MTLNVDTLRASWIGRTETSEETATDGRMIDVPVVLQARRVLARSATPRQA